MEDGFIKLIRYIEDNISFKCQNYKEKPLKRRLRVRMRALGLQDFFQYYDYLQNNQEELNKLSEVLTINLSYFFRNPETFDYLKEEILPQLKKKDNLVFWSAGCAMGEEPYSLAIICDEMALLNRVIIYGTDIDDDAIIKAKDGLYSLCSFTYTPESILKRYFMKDGNNFRINEKIKASVQFLNLDIFDKPRFGKCDLIMCRNVLIYLDRKAQSLILENLFEQLKPDGYLVIGKVELLLGIPEAKLFEIVNRTEHVYRKGRV